MEICFMGSEGSIGDYDVMNLCERERERACVLFEAGSLVKLFLWVVEVFCVVFLLLFDRLLKRFSWACRQPQVASSEGAPGVSVARKVTVKNGGGRREEDEKPGDCLKLGSRRVLVKIPGNKPKAVTTTGADAPQSQQPQQQPQVNKYNNSSSNDLKPEVGHIQDEEVIDSQAQQSSSKRPISDAVSLPQWGQKKRLRFNNRGAAAEEQQPPASTTTTDLKAAARGRASSVKSPSVPTVRIKRPASVAPKFPPSPELDNRRNVETTGATTTCNGSHVVNGESEANGTATRAAEVQQQQQNSSPEKVTTVAPAESSPAAAPAPPPPPPAPAAAPSAAANTTTDRAPHSQEKVDMDLFQWPKFIVSLTRKEKEDDFFAIKGTKLPVRPKKRSKHLEKAVTFISPGAWLCDITRERYEVKEKKTIKKRPRGLKAMGSADSDTD